MRLLFNFLFLCIIFLSVCKNCFSQGENIAFNPKVFYIGQDDNAYSMIIKDYPESLLTVSNDSMDLAYLNWMYLLKDIEDFSSKNNFDLNGLKIWMNVFWNKDGRIEVISFYPKPNCRNMEFENLKSFFKEFINQYNPRLKHKANFAHYGSARFPSFADMYINQK